MLLAYELETSSRWDSRSKITRAENVPRHACRGKLLLEGDTPTTLKAAVYLSIRLPALCEMRVCTHICMGAPEQFTCKYIYQHSSII